MFNLKYTLITITTMSVSYLLLKKTVNNEK